MATRHQYALVLKEFSNGRLVGSAYELPDRQADAEARFIELLSLSVHEQNWTPRFIEGQVDTETETRLWQQSGLLAQEADRREAVTDAA